MTVWWSCDWDYQIGVTWPCIACGPGTPPYGDYDYDNLDPKKWNSAEFSYTYNSSFNYETDGTPTQDSSHEWLEAINNPPAGCPKSTALAIKWKRYEAVIGSVVIGTDSNIYACKLEHTSTVDDRPITGANWATYWEIDPYNRTNGDTWQSNRLYYAKNVGQGNTLAMVTQGPWYTDTYPPYPGRFQFNILPNPFYHRMYYYSQSWADYAEGGRKLCYWQIGAAVSSSILKVHNMGATNPTLPLSESYDHRGSLWATRRPGISSNDINVYEGSNLDGRNGFFDPDLGQPDGNWPDCPETGAHTSQGILDVNTWHCIEFATYQHHTDGWLRVWLDGGLVINACKEAWGQSTYDTLPTYVYGGETWQGYIKHLLFTHERNGGVVLDNSMEYTTAHVIADQYIGPIGYTPPPTKKVPFYKRAGA